MTQLPNSGSIWMDGSGLVSFQKVVEILKNTVKSDCQPFCWPSWPITGSKIRYLMWFLRFLCQIKAFITKPRLIQQQQTLILCRCSNASADIKTHAWRYSSYAGTRTPLIAVIGSVCALVTWSAITPDNCINKIISRPLLLWLSLELLSAL